MPTTAYNASLGWRPRATVRAPDDDLFGQAMQPALDHIEYTPVAHSSAKDARTFAQESFGEAATAKYVHFFAQTPYKT